MFNIYERVILLSKEKGTGETERHEERTPLAYTTDGDGEMSTETDHGNYMHGWMAIAVFG